MKKIKYLIFIFLLLLVGCQPKEETPIEPVSQNKYLLGTIVTITLYDNPKQEIFDEIFTAIEDIETNKEGLSFVGEEIIGGIETTSMAIYSIDGRAARTAEGNRIATAGLAKGVYVIAVNSGKENKMYKFLIK